MPTTTSLQAIISALRARLQHEPDEVPVSPPIHDDLSGLEAHEIEQEISVIERRQELGKTDPRLLQPEGAAGLNYRRARLRAQQTVVGRKIL